jgi:dihydrofolate synthase / folylpolyglutamate synthase
MISHSPFARTAFKSYPKALQYLYDINAKLRADGVLAPSSTSLANTMNLYALIGKPLDRIPTIHIGGTNGKVIWVYMWVCIFLTFDQGTTCFKFAECLRASGFKTGLFVSPHISSFRERIQVDGALLPEDDFVVRRYSH